MPYNPINHNRRSIRLSEYDYTQQGAYFITVCTYHKECIFGEITSGNMKQSLLGEIAYYQWLQLINRFSHIGLDAFVIMPNHIHGIIIVKEPNIPKIRRGEAGENRHLSSAKIPISPVYPAIIFLDCEGSPVFPDTDIIPPTNSNQPHGTVPGSISAIIQNYKSLTTRKINMLLRTKNKTILQRNFYEHIIRDETDYDRIVEYIENNPFSWGDDRYYAK